MPYKDSKSEVAIMSSRKRQKKFHATWKYKDGRLRRMYGISLEAYQVLFESQNGLCSICGKPEISMSKGNIGKLRIDHDHNTGKVRGLLCWSCNSALGFVKEDIEILNKMIDYINKHK